MAEPDFDLAAHIAELSKSTEAGVALVTIAIIDEWLQKLLLTAMRDDLSNGVAKRLFGSYGPFYELASKADMAFALNLIDDETLDRRRNTRLPPGASRHPKCVCPRKGYAQFRKPRN